MFVVFVYFLGIRLAQRIRYGTAIRIEYVKPVPKHALGFRVYGVGFRVYGLELRLRFGLGFRVWGLGFGV